MHEQKKNQYDELRHQNSAFFCHLMQKNGFDSLNLVRLKKILKNTCLENTLYNLNDCWYKYLNVIYKTRAKKHHFSSQNACHAILIYD